MIFLCSVILLAFVCYLAVRAANCPAMPKSVKIIGTHHTQGIILVGGKSQALSSGFTSRIPIKPVKTAVIAAIQATNK